MDLSRILPPTATKVLSGTSSKKRLFLDLAELVNAAYGLPTEETVDALLERESLGPTGVGHGVALPHARIAGLENMAGAFIRLEKPVDFDSVDRQPVDLVFGLFAPLDAGVEHLKALAQVSRTMRDPAICAKLRANTDPLALHAILTESPATQAA